jgi:hypothetical protein
MSRLPLSIVLNYVPNFTEMGVTLNVETHYPRVFLPQEYKIAE